MALTTSSELPNIVAVEEVHAFIVRCMEAVGTPLDHAAALAKGLIAADSRGHYSHGLNRLGRPTLVPAIFKSASHKRGPQRCT